jgi:hypothetical protein
MSVYIVNVYRLENNCGYSNQELPIRCSERAADMTERWAGKPWFTQNSAWVRDEGNEGKCEADFGGGQICWGLFFSVLGIITPMITLVHEYVWYLFSLKTFGMHWLFPLYLKSFHLSSWGGKTLLFFLPPTISHTDIISLIWVWVNLSLNDRNSFEKEFWCITFIIFPYLSGSIEKKSSQMN